MKKILAVTFSDENETDKIFYSTYKWSKFILLSGHSAKNKARRKFNRQNILPVKNFQSTVSLKIVGDPAKSVMVIKQEQGFGVGRYAINVTTSSFLGM